MCITFTPTHTYPLAAQTKMTSALRHFFAFMLFCALFLLSFSLLRIALFWVMSALRPTTRIVNFAVLRAARAARTRILCKSVAR